MAGFTVDVWGAGEHVVLVHGALATGPEEWQGQRTLADEGYRLVVPTRSAYTDLPSTRGEDFRADSEELLPLLEGGAHLVGHSSGGVVALSMAAARPDLVRSLVLAEPPMFEMAQGQPEVARLQRDLERVFGQDELTDREFVERFLAAVGTPLEELPEGLLGELAAMAPAVRHGRRAWETGDLSLDAVASAPFPVLVVSGNHHPAFTAVAEVLADQLDATHTIVEGAGHEMQMVSETFNAALLQLWREETGSIGV